MYKYSWRYKNTTRKNINTARYIFYASTVGDKWQVHIQVQSSYGTWPWVFGRQFQDESLYESSCTCGGEPGNIYLRLYLYISGWIYISPSCIYRSLSCIYISPPEFIYLQAVFIYLRLYFYISPGCIYISGLYLHIFIYIRLYLRAVFIWAVFIYPRAIFIYLRHVFISSYVLFRVPLVRVYHNKWVDFRVNPYRVVL